MYKFYQYLKKGEQNQAQDWKQKVSRANAAQLSALKENTRSWQDWENN